MRAQQRNRLIWNAEQVVRLCDERAGETKTLLFDDIKAHANIVLKIARNDEAKFAGRIAPIRPGKRG